MTSKLRNTLLLLISTILVVTEAKHPDKLVARPGFGTLFYFQALADGSESVFRHSFFIPFPNLIELHSTNDEPLAHTIQPCLENIRAKIALQNRSPRFYPASQQNQPQRVQTVVAPTVTNITSDITHHCNSW